MIQCLSGVISQAVNLMKRLLAAHIFNQYSSERVCHKNDGTIPLNKTVLNRSPRYQRKPTTSCLLSWESLLSKSIEWSNRLLRDARPMSLTMFASYPNVRT